MKHRHFFAIFVILLHFKYLITVISVPPTVTILQPSYSVNVGNTITLECTVTSTLPVTSVQWQRNIGGSITTITSTSNTNKYGGSTTSIPSLTINSAELGDSGSYTCFATNIVGSGQSSATTLTVNASMFKDFCCLLIQLNFDSGLPELFTDL